MKVVSKHDNITVDGDLESNEFKIATTEKAFSILSDKLYSDKIKAVIRELSCNAYDAHIAANNKDKPFNIFFPSRLDQTFSIRDYGTGLSKENVMDLYSTYFSSTKNNSNKFIGALGLGSKSFFAYTKSANIVSYFNGTMYSFVAMLNEKNVPTIVFINSADTNEPNGLKVSFNCNISDINAFTSKGSEVLKWFPVKPNTNITIEKQPQELISGVFHGYEMGALQGNVLYPIKEHVVFPESFREFINKDILNFRDDLIYKFEIGQLDIAPSREELSYDKRTIDNIRKKIKQKAIELAENNTLEIEKAIESANSLWDAGNILGEKLDQNPVCMNKDYKWKNKSVPKSFMVPFIHQVMRSSAKSITKESTYTYHFDSRKYNIYIKNDKTKNIKEKIIKDRRPYSHSIIIHEDTFKLHAEALGNPTPVYLDKIEIDKKVTVKDSWSYTIYNLNNTNKDQASAEDIKKENIPVIRYNSRGYLFNNYIIREKTRSWWNDETAFMQYLMEIAGIKKIVAVPESHTTVGSVKIEDIIKEKLKIYKDTDFQSILEYDTLTRIRKWVNKLPFSDEDLSIINNKKTKIHFEYKKQYSGIFTSILKQIGRNVTVSKITEKYWYLDNYNIHVTPEIEKDFQRLTILKNKKEIQE